MQNDIEILQPGLATSLLRLWHHLSNRRQHQFVFLLVLMLVSAFADVISLGAVLPFLAILTSPDVIFNYSVAASAADLLGITSAEQLVLPLTLLFVTAAFLAGVLRILLLWVNTRLAFASGADLSVNVYKRTLYQPYWIHSARNSSEVISGISNKVGGAVNVLYQLLTLISSMVLLVAITIALIIVDPIVASVAIFAFGASYGIITWATRRRLSCNGKRIAKEQVQVIKALQEGLGGIRDVLLDGTQTFYCDIYRKADVPLRRAMGNNIFIASSPRYVMDSLGMILIAILAYVLSREEGGVASAIPVLGALAIGAQRLLPALQQSYGAWASIMSSHAALSDTIALLDQPMPEEESVVAPTALPFREGIHLSGIRFRYNNTGPWVVDGLNLKIAKGTRIGIVGSTGSGKSTVLDLIMGLLIPTEGKIVVDGELISKNNVGAWQQAIAHVPQSIYLADCSIAENIAFGVSIDMIDLQQVKEAARQAQIADFIETLEHGYSEFVGERGIRLSGGQRQRIGIARALYKHASVLVFDEATSALDNATEKSVMTAIEGLNRDLTIILIAHRLTTVKHCDTIVELGRGGVIACGSYEQLIELSPSFQKMVYAAGN